MGISRESKEKEVGQTSGLELGLIFEIERRG